MNIMVSIQKKLSLVNNKTNQSWLTNLHIKHQINDKELSVDENQCVSCSLQDLFVFLKIYNMYAVVALKFETDGSSHYLKM